MKKANQKLTASELELRNKWQEKFRRLDTDSPETDFAASVRSNLITNNMFKSLTDGTREETPQERRTPLSPIYTDSEGSMMTPSPLAR
ncbi:MAG: hypothetical protein P1U39_08135 [Legionellaceae bacterium]|nr:hypothetical protein [Legionellaceae bacterium]